MSQAMSPEAESRPVGPDAQVIADKYEVMEERGAFAAGTVFTVRHRLLDATCTLTLLPDGLAADAERLARVQDALRRGCQLRHAHIAPLLDFGQHDGRYHVTEAAVAGETLADLIRATGALSPAEALHIARQLADALAHAHELGLVHDALTPTSIVVQRETPPRAILRGFVTSALGHTPTLAYAAPERLRGEAANPCTDIFALGLVLFEMLEGRPFFAGDDADVRRLLLENDEPLLPKFTRIAPAGVASLVARAIRRAPRARQQGMTEVREEIDACLRRLGQTRLQAKDARPLEARTPRKVVLVVDDAVIDEEDTGSGPMAETPAPAAPRVAATPAASAPRARVATKTVAPTTAEAAVAARVFASGRSGAARSAVPVAGKVLVGAVVLALAWPVMRNLMPERSAPFVEPARPAAVAVQPAPLMPELGMPLVTPFPAIVVETVPARPARMPEPAPAPAEEPRPAVAAPAMRNTAPRFVTLRPRGRGPIQVMETRAMEFSAKATDKNPDDRVTYTWFVDGKRVGQGPSWRLVTRTGMAGATRNVEVQAADRAGAKARATWKVQVTARMTDVNVREWLGRLATALERNEVATLRLYGVTAPATKSKGGILGWLSGRGNIRISIANEAIRTEGRYATVAFDVSEVDGRGKVLSTRRESLELEKQANGFVGRRVR
jgi:serine/threonine-protein kinase